MRRIQYRWLIGVVLLLGATLSACGPSQEEVLEAERQAAFDALQEAKDALDAKRAELADAMVEAAAAASAEGEEAEEADEADEAEEAGEAGAAADAPDPAEVAARLESEVVDLANAFGQQLVQYINDEQIVPGEPLSERQLAAIRMKSHEDLILAQEYIDRGGDYKRAIRIYSDALVVDPDNEELKTALAEAEALRFMDEARFAAVKKGMTQDEVRALLGQVNLRNIRDYPERGVVAWFYPKDEGGGASAVYFRKSGDDYTVYRAEFSAVEGGGAEG